MSTLSFMLRPIGSIRNDALRRAALLIYGAPMSVALTLSNIVLAPVAAIALFVCLAAMGTWKALVETIECAIASIKAEPESWLVMFETFRRIWRQDRATWIASQPVIIVKKPNATPTKDTP